MFGIKKHLTTACLIPVIKGAASGPAKQFKSSPSDIRQPLADNAW
jgi:hypothetical protein